MNYVKRDYLNVVSLNGDELKCKISMAQRDSTWGKVLALHVAERGLVSSTPEHL